MDILTETPVTDTPETGSAAVSADVKPPRRKRRTSEEVTAERLEQDEVRKLKKAEIAERKAASPRKPRVPNPYTFRNGVGRPHGETKGAAVWRMIDDAYQLNPNDDEPVALNPTATLNDVCVLGMHMKLNQGTIRTTHAKWRAYYGMSVPRKKKEAAPVEAAPVEAIVEEEAPAEPAAE